MVTSPKHHRVVWPVIAVAAVMALAVGAVVGLLVGRVPPPTGLGAGVPPTSAPVTVQSFADTRPVTVTLHTAADSPLVVAVGGRVTRVPTALVVESGSAGLWVDGGPVIALATAEPLHRDVKVGDKGPDVAAFNAELARLGYGAPPGDNFTTATRAAWVKAQQAVGAPAVLTSVSYGRVMWLPASSVTVAGWLVAVGSDMPGGGVVAKVPGATVSAVVSLSGGGVPPVGPLLVKVSGVTLTVPDLSPVTDATFLAGVASQAKLQGVVPDASGDWQAPGTVSLASPVSVMGVPPVAVFALAGDRGCVEVNGRGVPVTVVGASLGVSLVTTQDGAPLSTVAIGTGITLAGC